MNYKEYLEKLKKKDGINLGAYTTGDFTLYLFLIFGAMAIGRIYGKILLALFTLSSLALALLFIPVIFRFKKENSNSISYQLFWLSVFLGTIAFLMMISS
ncbi:hypothetical protein [Methanocaldococcus infernus]|nr:hypothetical protein [Methanocaldococcus infernus]